MQRTPLQACLPREIRGPCGACGGSDTGTRCRNTAQAREHAPFDFPSNQPTKGVYTLNKHTLLCLYLPCGCPWGKIGPDSWLFLRGDANWAKFSSKSARNGFHLGVDALNEEPAEQKEKRGSTAQLGKGNLIRRRGVREPARDVPKGARLPCLCSVSLPAQTTSALSNWPQLARHVGTRQRMNLHELMKGELTPTIGVSCLDHRFPGWLLHCVDTSICLCRCATQNRILPHTVKGDRL